MTVTSRGGRALALVAALVAGACGGGGSGSEGPDEREGYWFDLSGEAPLEGLDAEQIAALRNLEGIGYAAGYEEAPAAVGVVTWEASRAQAGLNLYSSGHAPVAFLADMSGEVLHRWERAYDSLPDAPAMQHTTQNAWRRVRLLPDGSLLAIWDGLGLTKLDRGSNVVWHFGGPAHHDLDVAPDGRILVLTRRPAIVSRLNAKQPILDDAITTLSADGEVLARTSLVECLLNSSYSEHLVRAAREAGDILHTNTLELLDEQSAAAHPSWSPGDVLVCFRDLDRIAVIDLERRRTVWMTDGDWAAPHQPTVLENGNLLIFDNMGHASHSKVLELDPRTGAEAWRWSTEPPADFFSVFCGTAERLANGNTLVTESCRGHAFEVTPGGEIAWSFLSPWRAGDRKQLVAVLFEVQRIPRAAVAAWLER
ncbi:MAG: hypothetical protein GY711_12935 [bacterium]|nr:hypothetical protein [bacterium]